MGYVATSTPSRERLVRLKRRSSTPNNTVGNKRRVVDTPIDDDDKDVSLETDHDPPTDTFLALDATETDAVTDCACQTDLEGESIESMKMEIEKLRNECECLRRENDCLLKDNSALQEDNEWLRMDILKVKADAKNVLYHLRFLKRINRS